MAESPVLSESLLRELYESQKLSVSEIVQKLGCKPGKLRRRMAQWGVQARSRSEAMQIKRAKDSERRIDIPPTALRSLYEEERLSAAEIARRYDCSPGTVINRLHQYGIATKLPGKATVQISKQELEELYLKERLSLRQIARRSGCDHSTIKNKLEAYGLRKRTYGEANQIYPKRDFDGNLADKAYLIGFRLGDLYVTTMGQAGQTIVVECATTKQEQLDLITRLFSPYGHIHIGNPKRRGDRGIACYLNLSFAFLLPKEDSVPDWVRANDTASAAFAAGYIDAEGSFFLSQESAHFAVSSYDGGILNWLYTWMSNLGVHSPQPRRVGRQGAQRPNGAVYRKDLWLLSVSRKTSLLRLIDLLEPHLKHSKRRSDLQKARLNIEMRNTHRPGQRSLNNARTKDS